MGDIFNADTYGKKLNLLNLRYPARAPKWKGGTFLMEEYPKYYNYDYEKGDYYEVVGPLHDHYHFVYEENAWYEDIFPEDDLK